MAELNDDDDDHDEEEDGLRGALSLLGLIVDFETAEKNCAVHDFTDEEDNDDDEDDDT